MYGVYDDIYLYIFYFCRIMAMPNTGGGVGIKYIVRASLGGYDKDMKLILRAS